MRSRTSTFVIVAVLATALFAASASAGDGEKALARKILSATNTTGGLVVHVGCGDGRLTAALRSRPWLTVQGLADTQAEVDAARAYLLDRGLQGPVVVDLWDGARLPYADNLVNLIVCEDPANLDRGEVTRVLAPNGVAYLKTDGRWESTVKPWPDDIDEWTHYLHGPDGNPVSHDTVVGPPRRLQWVGGPRWARHHDHMASMTSLVSAKGRLFYMFDEGPTASIQLPAQWLLIARDAFNGTPLWKRDMGPWNTTQWPLKSGPAHLLRRLVAVDDLVFATLSLEGPVEALDAATGETTRTFKGSEGTMEIIVSGETLLAVASLDPAKLLQWQRRDTYVWDNTKRANRDWAWTPETGGIRAYNTRTGRKLWEAGTPVAPCSVAADSKRLIFHDGERVVCLSLSDGKPAWQSEPVEARLPVATGTGIRTLINNGVVLCAGNTGAMTALSAADGSTLWQGKQLPSGHQSLKDLFVTGGLAWTGAIAGGKDSGAFIGYNPLTGEAESEFEPDLSTYWFHHRCYPAKATDRFLLTSRTGIEFIDPETEHWEAHHWVRGGCIIGIMPCNGMVYAPMHSCGCYLEAKLNGLNALAPGPVAQPDEQTLSDASRLERGPAYGHSDTPSTAGDWPTYRHDPARSGATSDAVSLDAGGWQTQVGGRLTSPVVAGGRLYVASIDTHTLHALDQETGAPLWTRTVGGRIDSPPTIHSGLVLFGSADGWVYALRESDGALAWRYRAAPMDLRIGAFEQIESAWPVHGSILVQDDVLYCTAGRSIFLDGGIRLLQLDPATGRKLSETVMDERDPDTGENMQKHVKGLNMPVALSDILSSDGDHLYMRSQKIDLDGNRVEIPLEDVSQQPAEGSHLFCQVGFLDDSWFHRSFWTFGRRVTGGYGSWFQAARHVPAGRILVFDDDRVYGYGRKPEYIVNASVLEYHLFSAEKYADPEAIRRVRMANREMNTRLDRNAANASDWKLRSYFPEEDLTAARFQWKIDQPAVQVRAMVAAGDHLIAAGHPDTIDERQAFRVPEGPGVQAQLARQAEALKGLHGGKLWTIGKADGAVSARYDLDVPPVFDGLAVAGGRLYASAIDGSVRCLALDAGLAPADADEPISVISDEPIDPDYLKPPEVDRSADFGEVTGCRVVESDLGYRLQPAGSKPASLAINPTSEPLAGQVSLTCKVRVNDGTGTLQNGFIAFGDGPTDDKLIKCGIRYRLQKGLIVQGELLDPVKSAGVDVDGPLGKVLDLTVNVDLDEQTVTLIANGTTIQATLVRELATITHVGFAGDNAIVEFSPVQVSGP